MKIMVTGGTGFIGSHTAKALLDGGHEVRLLIRDEDKARRVFGVMGYAVPPCVKGDMTDRDSVVRCMDGCDAVFHSAALVSVDPSQGERMVRENLLGTETVLGEACKADVRSILYVSSVAAFFEPGDGPITADSPLASSKSAYTRSKIEAEKYARSLMDDGRPVSISYPSAVIGPDDPGWAESNYSIIVSLKLCSLITSGGFQFIDVRDLARIHRLILERDGGPGLYLAGGVYHTWREMADLLDRVTGRRLLRVRGPGALFRAMGRAYDIVRPVVRLGIPFSHEAMQYATQWRLMDDGATRETLGVRYRDPEITLRDTIRWLHRAGRVSGKQSGIAAD